MTQRSSPPLSGTSPEHAEAWLNLPRQLGLLVKACINLLLRTAIQASAPYSRS